MTSSLTPIEAAKLTGLSQQHVTRLCREGRLRARSKQRGIKTFWEIDSECAYLKSLIKETPTPVTEPTTALIDWNEWEFMCQSGVGNLTNAPLSPRSLKEYRSALNDFLVRYRTISVTNLHAAYKTYLDRMLPAHPNHAPDTDFLSARKRVFYAVLSGARYLEYKRLVPTDLVKSLETQIPKRLHPQRPQPCYTKEVVERAIRFINTNRNYDSYERATNRALIRTLFVTGLRNAELRNLKVSDLDFDGTIVDSEPSIRVVKGKGRKDRVVPMPPALAAELRSYLRRRALVDAHCNESRSPWLFITCRGNRMTAKTLCAKLERIGNHLGIRLTAHSLRRTCATYYAKDLGVSVGIVSELLGHTDLATTSLYVKDSARSVVKTLNAVY